MVKVKALFALFCLALVGWAGEPEKPNFVEAGANVNDVSDADTVVSEYADTENDVDAVLRMRHLHAADDVHLQLDLDYRTPDDMDLEMSVRKGGWLKSTTRYQKLTHKLGHDAMQGFGFRESTDPDNNTPGGKMVTFEDLNPGDHYGVTYEDLQQIFEFMVGESVPTTIEVGFRAQRRDGIRQAMSVSHCDNCHLESQTAHVDEVTTDLWAKLVTRFARAELSYKFTHSQFENDTPEMTRYFDLARHPVTGASGVEFTTRQIYDGETLPINHNGDNESTTHTFKAHGSLSNESELVGSVALVETTNEAMNLDYSATSGSVRYSHTAQEGKLFADVWLTSYKLESDEIFMDLPSWREGRAGGGQDFDFWRYSATDRTVTMLKARATFKLDSQSRLTAGYRLKDLSRDHLATTYEDLAAGRGSDAISHRLDVRYDRRNSAGRFWGKVNYEITDHPFANANGILEQPLDMSPLPDNTQTFYFQRVRTGEASNQPSKDLSLSLSYSGKVGKGTHYNLLAKYRDAQNDELNSYTWDMSSMTADASLFATLGGNSILTAGYGFHDVASDALVSIPIFDG